MSSGTKLYEGKAKIVYATDRENEYLTYYKDDATAFNAQKRGTILGKGEVNCTICSALMQWLETKGIPTHFIAQVSPREMLVKGVRIIPLEVVVRNIAAGSLCKQTGLPWGYQLPFPLVEFYLKNDDLGDPLLTEERLQVLNIVSPSQLRQIKEYALKINKHLQEFFRGCNIILVDFKLEFGLDSNSQLILADEISPDTCRLWDALEQDTQKRVLDKDRFRQDLGDIEAAYQRVRERVLAQIEKLKNS
ncbi:MAG: phosphoribosylaminoimidazolesuccinocarboxamide synthase [Geminocystis sp.]|nr:phosphoribosylaminoimidazolesuccinocarboxamide synthase [Geminocystis sp.]HIK37322.1 phosphoribosylaminoimidazolesuccinocarboxamide synthase [Geminocystis sp. M7585_C2015_104]MCS7148279.1 phosphoribosylaminoimidazolesuccinocarboxamide synthase [Geminocystis sp.]MCX8077694.1 phosphoribosylaminoimidazolesuccinocarboxamide synthase [Geminocystis sp.]MDW8116586.1 phosphoribosylaminoimidazolesuccinocarboxamide synthase [Geminocystis sp.]